MKFFNKNWMMLEISRMELKNCIWQPSDFSLGQSSKAIFNSFNTAPAKIVPYGTMTSKLWLIYTSVFIQIKRKRRSMKLPFKRASFWRIILSLVKVQSPWNRTKLKCKQNGNCWKFKMLWSWICCKLYARKWWFWPRFLTRSWKWWRRKVE